MRNHPPLSQNLGALVRVQIIGALAQHNQRVATDRTKCLVHRRDRLTLASANQLSDYLHRGVNRRA